MSREGYAPSQTHLIDIPREESQLWTFAFPRHMGEKRYFSFPAEPNMVCVQPTVQLQRNLVVDQEGFLMLKSQMKQGVFINPAFIEPFGLTLIEAAAHGLPLLPQKMEVLWTFIDKQLWGRCRQNGLKNIHLFSWPEHCKTYLARIACCKQRQPEWQKPDDGFESSGSDSLVVLERYTGYIFKFEAFSGDEKNEGSRTLDNYLDSEENAVNGKSKLENAVSSLSKGVSVGTQKDGSIYKSEHHIGSSKSPALRKRKYIFVIAVDGDGTTDFLESIKMVVETVRKDNYAGSVGFILSTSLAISEMHSLLVSGDGTPGLPFLLDSDYHSHIEYRWGGEDLRKTLLRWAASTTDEKGEEGPIVSEDKSGSTTHCYVFKVEKPELIPSIKELRKSMRIQALRCHVIYCQNGNKLNIIPVLASRSQALRYLHVRWGIDLSHVVVFVGEHGDTDYEGLLGGLHKTVILKGVGCSVGKHHAHRYYPLEDVVPFDSPNITQTEGCNSNSIRASLGKLGVLKV
ncbi:putative sucrose-phosphate synthase 1 [Vitis vinifera]|uniref:Putative sucrose-phosphate synthase 1 n=1 Tax=Vitis vinifera TaxID=29760 RepID=A0A438FZF7_VITVI|nr:putative sucrose-phosphate synthase 1 [Vitis vinifera]